MNRIEFFQKIGTGIRKYLPFGYREYAIHIKEVEFSGQKYALLILEKEGIRNMPVMNLEPYLDRIGQGSDESVLIDIAVDYVKIASLPYRTQKSQDVHEITGIL